MNRINKWFLSLHPGITGGSYFLLIFFLCCPNLYHKNVRLLQLENSIKIQMKCDLKLELNWTFAN